LGQQRSCYQHWGYQHWARPESSQNQRKPWA
jgi:hypothetical protein